MQEKQRKTDLCLKELHVKYKAEWNDNAVQKSKKLLATSRRRREINQETVLFIGNCEEYEIEHSAELYRLSKNYHVIAGCSAKSFIFFNVILCVYSFGN